MSLFLISCSQGILNATLLSWLLLLKITCLHVSFTAYENFYKISKMYCHLVLTFHFPIFRMSECRNPTIKHIFTYTLISPFISTYVIDLFLGSISHSKIPLSPRAYPSVIQHTFPTKSQLDSLSVCLSLSDLGFNILPVDSYFDQVLGLFHFLHLLCPTPTSFGDY